MGFFFTWCSPRDFVFVPTPSLPTLLCDVEQCHTPQLHAEADRDPRRRSGGPRDWGWRSAAGAPLTAERGVGDDACRKGAGAGRPQTGV